MPEIDEAGRLRAQRLGTQQARAPVLHHRRVDASVLSRGVMALLGLVHGGGPFPEADGAWSHDPGSLTAAERTAAASLYAALMTATCLDRLGAGDTGPARARRRPDQLV